MLLALPSCLTKQPATIPQSISCKVHQYTPPPTVHATACGANVCISQADAVALSKWIASMKETGASLAACSLIEQVP